MDAMRQTMVLYIFDKRAGDIEKKNHLINIRTF